MDSDEYDHSNDNCQNDPPAQLNALFKISNTRCHRRCTNLNLADIEPFFTEGSEGNKDHFLPERQSPSRPSLPSFEDSSPLRCSASTLQRCRTTQQNFFSHHQQFNDLTRSEERRV